MTMKKINKLFNFLDLIEYNEIQKNLIEWTNEKGLQGDFPNIFEDINEYENDIRFTVAKIYSKDKLRAVWLTSVDSETVQELRREGEEFNLSIEIWCAAENEWDEDMETSEDENQTDYSFNFSGIYAELDGEEVIKHIENYLDNSSEGQK